MYTEQMKHLYLELTSLENRGITIWMEGIQCNSEQAAAELCINEENFYMRDYVFDEGVLKELHFDRLSKDDKKDKLP